MEMPKPGDAHARLEKLVGEWKGGEVVHPAPWDPVGGTATASIANRRVLDGFAVVQEYQQHRGGNSTFSGHGLFWWDPANSQYVMTWTDSMMGTPSHYRGDFEGDVLRLANAMPQGGFARCSFDCSTPGTYLFLMETSPDGESWAPAMEGTYARVTPAKARPATKAAKKSSKAAPAKRAPQKASKKAAPRTAAKKNAARKKAAPKRAAKKAARGKK